MTSPPLEDRDALDAYIEAQRGWGWKLPPPSEVFLAGWRAKRAKEGGAHP